MPSVDRDVARRVRFGETEVTRMGLGTNRLTRDPENADFIRAAVGARIGVIDTAHLYTGGSSEETLGEALDGVPRPATIVATKGGYGSGEGSREVLTAQIESSFRRLRVTSIDLYYLHRVHPPTPLEESLGVIREYVDRGQIRHVGISDVGVEQIERARAVVPIAAVQNEYNMYQRKWDDVVDYCTREEILFVPFYPLHVSAGGELQRIADRHGATQSQIALAWLLHRSPVVLPIPGTLSVAHVKENLGALDIQLTDEELARLSS